MSKRFDPTKDFGKVTPPFYGATLEQEGRYYTPDHVRVFLPGEREREQEGAARRLAEAKRHLEDVQAQAAADAKELEEDLAAVGLDPAGAPAPDPAAPPPPPRAAAAKATRRTAKGKRGQVTPRRGKPKPGTAAADADAGDADADAGDADTKAVADAKAFDFIGWVAGEHKAPFSHVAGAVKARTGDLVSNEREAVGALVTAGIVEPEEVKILKL